MVVAADPGRLFRLGQLVHLLVGELEEGQRAAVLQGEKGVAELDLAAEIGAVGLLAPGRDQRNAEQVFEKPAVGFVILDDIGVMVEPPARGREAA